MDTPVFEELRLVDRGLNRSVGDCGITICPVTSWLLMALGLICSATFFRGVDGAELATDSFRWSVCRTVEVLLLVLARRAALEGITGVLGLTEPSVILDLTELALAELRAAGALRRLAAFVGGEGCSRSRSADWVLWG